VSTLRLFVGFDAPQNATRLALDCMELLREAGADVSWERAEKLHCTLKFLGDVSEDRLLVLAGALRETAGDAPPFRVRFGGVGSFPGRGNPRVLWMGVENSDGLLAALQRRIEDSFERAGFSREERPFHPHLTLGRIKSPRNQLRLTAIQETLTLRSEPFAIREIKLVSSALMDSGSVYTERMAVPLVGNPSPGE
jgi:2'-5' RNA ligase